MNQPNPAWKPLLDKLPPALHASVMPVLQEWDKGVQDLTDKIHKEYEPLKPFQPFVDNNVTPDFAWQSVVFADELQNNPAKVAAQINEAWDLGLIDKATHEQALSEAQANSSNDDGDLFSTEDGQTIDLTKIPEFANMKQVLDTMQQTEEQKRQQEEQEQALADFNKELDDLEASVTGENKPFNRTIVTAFISQGLSPEDAVKQFHTLLGENAQVDETQGGSNNSGDAPITMGNSGTVGGGTDDGSPNWAGMKTSEFNENVAKALEAMQTGNSS